MNTTTIQQPMTAAAGMGYGCDTISRVENPADPDAPYLLRCKGEAVAKFVIIKGGRRLTVKRCAVCRDILRAQSSLGRVVIESETKL